MKTKILILGAGGFIGSHMVEHLVSSGQYHVVGVDVESDKLSTVGNDNFTYHHLDLRTERDSIGELVHDCDLVVDLIAHANPSLYVSSPIEVFELNFTQNLHVARLCMQHNKRLIQYSSAEVYGKTDNGEAYSEYESDMTFGPVTKQRWIYASGKMLLERILFAYGEAGDLNYTIVRPFNFIGSRIDYLVPPATKGGPRVFPHMMSALLTGGPIQLVDGGLVHRAFLHIDDANEAFQILLDKPNECRNHIFNIGNPDNNTTIKDMAVLMKELYEELTGKPSRSKLIEVTGEQFYGEGYEDSDRMPPDIRRMCALGWSPRHDLRATLRDTMAYYLESDRSGMLINAKDINYVPIAV